MVHLLEIIAFIWPLNERSGGYDGPLPALFSMTSYWKICQFPVYSLVSNGLYCLCPGPNRMSASECQILVKTSCGNTLFGEISGTQPR